MNERNAYPLRVEAMVSAGMRPLPRLCSCVVPVRICAADSTDPYLAEAPSLSSSSSWTLDQTATKFAGEWAQPSVQHLRQLMRHVFTNREEAKRCGAPLLKTFFFFVNLKPSPVD